MNATANVHCTVVGPVSAIGVTRELLFEATRDNIGLRREKKKLPNQRKEEGWNERWRVIRIPCTSIVLPSQGERKGEKGKLLFWEVFMLSYFLVILLAYLFLLPTTYRSPATPKPPHRPPTSQTARF
jgi:hypothetical protein